MFSLIRLIVVIPASVLFFLWIKKAKTNGNRTIAVIFTVLFGAFFLLFSLFPIENAFVRFESPEKAFKYAKEGEIFDTLEGEESALILYMVSKDTSSRYIVPKDEKGYKIENISISRYKVFHKFDKDGAIDVYHVIGTDDYYIVGVFTSEQGKQPVVDSQGRRIKCFNQSCAVEAYTYLDCLPEDYYWIVNGEKIY